MRLRVVILLFSLDEQAPCRIMFRTLYKGSGTKCAQDPRRHSVRLSVTNQLPITLAIGRRGTCWKCCKSSLACCCADTICFWTPVSAEESPYLKHVMSGPWCLEWRRRRTSPISLLSLSLDLFVPQCGVVRPSAAAADQVLLLFYMFGDSASSFMLQ